MEFINANGMVKMEHLNPYTFFFFFGKEQNLSNENTELDPIA